MSIVAPNCERRSTLSIPSQARRIAEACDSDYDANVSSAVTDGIRVNVSTQYVPQQSVPQAKRYVFAYTVKIANEGSSVAQLRSRHWVITDGNGKVEEVKGPGVVGQQPTLQPGEKFEYTSGCVLATPRGTMHGSYQMHREDGSQFDAVIAPFDLMLPYSLN